MRINCHSLSFCILIKIMRIIKTYVKRTKFIFKKSWAYKSQPFRPYRYDVEASCQVINNEFEAIGKKMTWLMY